MHLSNESLAVAAAALTNAQLRAVPLPVSGSCYLATQPVSVVWAGLTDAELRASALAVSLAATTVTNTVAVDQKVATTATLANVAASAISVTLRAANSAREGITIANNSTAVLYVKFGVTASPASYTVRLEPGDYFEVPFKYSGRIDGIWSTADGFACVTELT